MSTEAVPISTWLAGIAYAQASTVVVTQKTHLSDLQVALIVVGLGLIGGLFATLNDDVVLTKKDLARRMIASGMIAPGILLFAFWKWELEMTLLPVVAVAGVSGLAAWPIAQALPKLIPKLLRESFDRWRRGGDKS